MSMKNYAFILAALMFASAVGGLAARPSAKASELGRAISLKATVPAKFGDWTELPGDGNQVVNPQVQKQLDELYSDLLTRTYVNSKGYRIMLSLAYGEDQRGALKSHKPEVCYPAQGFTLLSNDEAAIATDFGPIPGRRLRTSLGQRTEPVTYWFAMGNHAVMNNFQKRWVQLTMALTGQIPDGLLFRVSSIDTDSAQAFRLQDQFVNDLLHAVSASDRARLSGVRGPVAGT